MLKRIFSTLTLWAVVAGAIYYGKSAGWSVLIFILSAGSVKEVCDLIEKLGYAPLRKTVQLANLAIFLSAFFGDFANATSMGGVFAFSLFSIAIAASIVKRPYDEYAGKSVIPTILILAAVSLSLQWLVVVSNAIVSNEYAGVIVAIWIVAAAKFSDVGAYVIGAAFGRHKMSPTISPNKTIEGAVGGIISSALISGVVFGYAQKCSIISSEISIFAVMFAGAFIGAVAIISDLLESVLKRRTDIKDSGKFIPGIGGALDLSDSLLLTSPLGFILFWIISSL